VATLYGIPGRRAIIVLVAILALAASIAGAIVGGVVFLGEKGTVFGAAIRIDVMAWLF